MAKAAGSSQAPDVSRGKLVLIAVLGVILMTVLYLQFAGTSTSSHADRRSEEAPARPNDDDAASDAESTDEVTPIMDDVADLNIRMNGSLNERLWASPRLAEVIEYDPFALPARFPQPVPMASLLEASTEADRVSAQEQLTSIVEELQMQLEELRQRGVHVIVRDRDGYVAMIGDRTVHVGDDINGFTVTAIEPNGVRVERKIQE